MRKTLIASLVLVFAICEFSSRAHAQEFTASVYPEPSKAEFVETKTETAPVAPTHKFFDRQNVGSTVMTFSAALADGITTQHALGIRRTTTTVQGGMMQSKTVTYVERNPIAAPLVNRGWSGQIAATALTAGADLALRNWMHRKGHHRIERWIPFAFAATSAGFAAHNAHYW